MTEYKNPEDIWFANHRNGHYTTARISSKESGILESIDLTKNDLVVTITPKLELPTFWQLKTLSGQWGTVYMAKDVPTHEYYAGHERYRQVETPKGITK